jgi:hypothetical protein
MVMLQALNEEARRAWDELASLLDPNEGYAVESLVGYFHVPMSRSTRLKNKSQCGQQLRPRKNYFSPSNLRANAFDYHPWGFLLYHFAEVSVRSSGF